MNGKRAKIIRSLVKDATEAKYTVKPGSARLKIFKDLAGTSPTANITTHTAELGACGRKLYKDLKRKILASSRG
jgi:hypothetical protein